LRLAVGYRALRP